MKVIETGKGRNFHSCWENNEEDTEETTETTETTTEVEPEITEIEAVTTTEESAEETAKKTEIALDMLINGTTETKMTDSEVDYDVDMHIKSERHSYWDTYTVKATTRCKAIDIALDRLVNETGINKTSVDCIRIYKSGESELLKEYWYESDDEKIPDLTKFNNAIIKALGMTHVKEVRYTVQGVNVFFEYNGNMYKCYTPQSKLYKLSGQCFKLITWKDLKKEASETDDNNGSYMYTTRPPPDSSLLNLSIK